MLMMKQSQTTASHYCVIITVNSVKPEHVLRHVESSRLFSGSGRQSSTAFINNTVRPRCFFGNNLYDTKYANCGHKIHIFYKLICANNSERSSCTLGINLTGAARHQQLHSQKVVTYNYSLDNRHSTLSLDIISLKKSIILGVFNYACCY